jgi:UDP-glucose 4-epimerase
MKALVTGGAGFIGSHIVDRLVNDGHEVIVIDNESADSHEQFYYNDKAFYYKYDICDFELIKSLFHGVDIVFHLAAEARIQPSLLNPRLAVNVNTMGTLNVLQAAREANVDRVIYSSTSSAYGLANTPPCREDMKTDCLNPYSVSKVAGEQLCKMYYSLFGLKTITFRYFNVYGARQPLKGQYAPVIGLFMRQHAAGEPMTVVGNGTQRRDFTNVQDVVEANMCAALTTNQNAFGGLFNIGTGTNYNIIDLAQMISRTQERFVDGKELWTFIPPRLGEAHVSLADVSRAKTLLNWQAKITLPEWIMRNK